METLTDRVFAWMRHEFAPLLGACERDIRPDTPLSRFLPRERRREFWSTAQRQFDLRLPALELPPAMQLTGHWLALASMWRTILVCLLLGAKWIALPLAACDVGRLDCSLPLGDQALGDGTARPGNVRRSVAPALDPQPENVPPPIRPQA